MTRPVLVTGGAGFIGSSVVAALAGAGLHPVALDDLSGGFAENLPPGVPLVEADVADPAVSEVITDIAPEAVVHAAAQVSVSASELDPARDRVVNVEGTANVISGALEARVQRLVFLSSGGAIYGECDGAGELDLPRPASHYGAHKYLAERYLELSGLSYATARLANVYGPGQRAGLEGGVVSTFLEKLVAGEQITINGTGEQSRDFIYVDDVVEAVISMLDSSLQGVWNVGTGKSTSVIELLNSLQTELGTTATPRYALPRPGDVQCSCLSPDLLAADLGWRPRNNLNSGVRRTIQA